jgi:hypothetical protein
MPDSSNGPTAPIPLASRGVGAQRLADVTDDVGAEVRDQ